MAALNAEAEMPLEELLAMYGRSSGSAPQPMASKDNEMAANPPAGEVAIVLDQPGALPLLNGRYSRSCRIRNITPSMSARVAAQGKRTSLNGLARHLPTPVSRILRLSLKHEMKRRRRVRRGGRAPGWQARVRRQTMPEVPCLQHACPRELKVFMLVASEKPALRGSHQKSVHFLHSL